RDRLVVVDLERVARRTRDVAPVEGDVLARAEARVVRRRGERRRGQRTGRRGIDGQRRGARVGALRGRDRDRGRARDGRRRDGEVGRGRTGGHGHARGNRRRRRVVREVHEETAGRRGAGQGDRAGR